DTRVVMMLTWISTYGIRLPLAWLGSGVDIPLDLLPSWLGGGAGVVLPNPAPLQHLFDIGPLAGMWIGLCTEHLTRATVFTARFLQGGWQRVKV
ncbi:MAG: hypothetical protein KDA20_12840, partial [Phycisphaerales bacterium]|nr:hypothetical protein [Phycisphaerales bacterium]